VAPNGLYRTFRSPASYEWSLTLSTMQIVRAVTFLFIIIVGGLAFTNLGVICIACGDTLNKVLAAVAVVLGVVALIAEFRGGAVRT
jgi:hypothetical protein